MLYFHGTTKRGLQAILSGEGIKPSSPWTCSSGDDNLYVWPLDKTAEANELDLEEELEEVIRLSITQSIESARVQACMTQEEHLYVLCFDIPEEDDYMLNDDYSCENMNSIASYIDTGIIYTKDLLRYLSNVYYSEFNKWYIPFHVAGLLSNHHFNKWDIDQPILDLAVVLNRAECFNYDILEVDYKEINIKEVCTNV